MRIDKIHYQLNCVVGSGLSESFTFIVEPELGDSLDNNFAELRDWAHKVKMPSENDIYHKIQKGQQALRELDARIEEKKQQWNEMRTFLIAQGINPNAPEMPLPLKSLPQAIDGEIVDKDI
ncbi:hypothetical protein [Floridanema aerugineum]|uniref:Uncharacterized protein n=1 Tax=Floridaenema aerugineum BLCC-F46 TaxID=3153654 RepID=A0ABV4X7D1_9CYAN